MKIGKLPVALVICSLFLAVPFADAQTVDKGRAGVTQVSEKVSVEVYSGYLRGQSLEIVYNPSTGHKESELTWSIDNAWAVGGTLALRPVDWLTLKVGGWIPVRSSNTMDDYDWDYAGRSDWSDWSHHPYTKMNRAHMINAGVAARVAKFGPTSLFDRAQLEVVAGYRWFYVNWTAYGGSYIYSSKPGWRDVTGSDSDSVAVIAYEQWIETPYVGLGGSMSINRWSFSGELTGSLWGRASDRDDHYQRTLLYESKFKNMPMLAGEFSAGYALTDRISLFGSFVYQKYFEAQGSTSAINYSTSEVQYASGDAAGMDHYSMLLNLGLKWVMF